MYVNALVALSFCVRSFVSFFFYYFNSLISFLFPLRVIYKVLVNGKGEEKTTTSNINNLKSLLVISDSYLTVCITDDGNTYVNLDPLVSFIRLLIKFAKDDDSMVNSLHRFDDDDDDDHIYVSFYQNIYF